MSERQSNNIQKIIAGPCAVESEKQVEITVQEAKKIGIQMIRGNIWKPRTEPGFEGVGAVGIPWLQAAAQEGLGISLEVILPEHVDLILENIFKVAPHAAIQLWIGSRNQNHLLQREIASRIAGDKRVSLMLKNQPWRDKRHWKGMVEHAKSGGLLEDQLSLCHRGFAPWDAGDTPMRNVPDLHMAKEVKEETGLPIFLDPSHIGGTVHLVKKLVKEFGNKNWIDGQVIEVHPDPKNALTDAKQQLTWQELAELLGANS